VVQQELYRFCAIVKSGEVQGRASTGVLLREIGAGQQVRSQTLRATGAGGRAHSLAYQLSVSVKMRPALQQNLDDLEDESIGDEYIIAFMQSVG